MNRRGFFGRLVAGVAGLVGLRATRGDVVQPGAASREPHDLQAMIWEMSRGLERPATSRCAGHLQVDTVYSGFGDMLPLGAGLSLVRIPHCRCGDDRHEEHLRVHAMFRAEAAKRLLPPRALRGK